MGTVNYWVERRARISTTVQCRFCGFQYSFKTTGKGISDMYPTEDFIDEHDVDVAVERADWDARQKAKTVVGAGSHHCPRCGMYPLHFGNARCLPVRFIFGVCFLGSVVIAFVGGLAQPGWGGLFFSIAIALSAVWTAFLRIVCPVRNAPHLALSRRDRSGTPALAFPMEEVDDDSADLSDNDSGRTLRLSEGQLKEVAIGGTGSVFMLAICSASAIAAPFGFLFCLYFAGFLLFAFVTGRLANAFFCVSKRSNSL